MANTVYNYNTEVHQTILSNKIPHRIKIIGENFGMMLTKCRNTHYWYIYKKKNNRLYKIYVGEIMDVCKNIELIHLAAMKLSKKIRSVR